MPPSLSHPEPDRYHDDNSGPGAPADGLLAGAAALWFGVRFLLRRTDLWNLAAVPALLTLILGAAGGGTGLWLGFTAVQRLFAARAGLDGLFAMLLGVAVGLLTGLLGVLLGTSLAVPLSGSALERIAMAVRSELGLPAPQEGLRTSVQNLGTGLLATALTWGVGLAGTGLLTLVGILIPGAVVLTLPLKGALLALLLTFDLGDYAFTLAGLSLGGRLLWMRRHLRAALGFGALAILLLCIPGLGLLLLPATVAGVVRLTRTP